MPSVRPYRVEDAADLARICLATADNGGDATGQLDDDDILPELFVLPYVTRHPDLAFILCSDDDRPIGYIVGTDDTSAFEAWFGAEWWPRNAQRWPMPASFTTRTAGMIAYGYSRGHASAAEFAKFPAELHIDLLPEGQGAGWGRVLIGHLAAALRERGVAGVRAGVSKENPGALAFYPRVGFENIASDERSQTFGLPLD
ncbi:ribosomal protein S18 acetylase RimI-like enzyme [Microbacterium terrae]|uniref:Acetyltransferase (GNAT) family protein n=1 Tax=Microbacterium terrae TaxID=69369 RepID=A0A0M2GV75_9MICO|nr:GNAT family N-acetyltransferase [Microbacterium terrae]KJL37551.1 Acetyltransferase (GNAT) family protein [Microbacterium terrae]MBP1076381.1 ribosomal protein S18 acetylase RimI-like enzyme [Microbacterium terrae]